jgi:hypothetical protein
MVGVIMCPHSAQGGERVNTKRLQICLFGGVVSAVFCVLGRQVIYGFSEIQMTTIAPHGSQSAPARVRDSDKFLGH